VADEADEFDAFYLRCRDRLVMQVAAMCGDANEAMDFVQEAFARAWLRWSKVSTYDEPEAWVRRVALNLSIGRWRRARRLVLDGELPERSVELPDEQEELMSALQTLPAKQRRAIVLHHLVGLSVEETAADLSAPVASVKSWLSRGRDRLAVVLTAEGRSAR
jgi:RNA polymerase sigma-70 factor (ECF subfamily)